MSTANTTTAQSPSKNGALQLTPKQREKNRELLEVIWQLVDGLESPGKPVGPEPPDCLEAMTPRERGRYDSCMKKSVSFFMQACKISGAANSRIAAASK